MKRSKRVKTALVATALGLACAGNAFADGFYFGLGGGLTSTDIGSKGEIDDTFEADLGSTFPVLGIDSTLDDSDTGFSVQVGYRWGSYVAAEVGYVDLGEALYAADIILDGGPGLGAFPVGVDLRAASQGITTSVLGILPLNKQFEAYGRAGIYFGDTRTRGRVLDEGVVTFSDEVRSDSKDLFLGLGGVWNINGSYSLRLEYQRFLDVGDDDDLGDEADIDLISLSILFR